MTHVILTVVWPSSMDTLKAAALPTDPPALAAYTLLVWFVLLVWWGNRGSGKKDEGAEGGVEGASDSSKSGGADAGEAEAEGGGGDGPRKNRRTAPRGSRGKLSRAQRRRRGYINWIQ